MKTINRPLKNTKQALYQELKKLPENQIGEVYSFVLFLRTKPLISRIDPSQAYFWSTKWQQMEKEAEEDKKKNRIIGTGKVEDLLEALKHAD